MRVLQLFAVVAVLGLSACAGRGARLDPLDTDSSLGMEGSGGGISAARYATAMTLVGHTPAVPSSPRRQTVNPGVQPTLAAQYLSLTLSAASGATAMSLTTGAYLDLGGGSFDRIRSDGTQIEIEADVEFAGWVTTTGATSASIRGKDANDNAGIGVVLDNTIALTTDGAKTVDFKTGGVSRAYIDHGGGIRLGLQDQAKPTCDASHRGTIWYDPAANGSLDTLEICRKSALDSYDWVTLF